MAKYQVSRTDGTPIPADEPCFVFRAKDLLVLPALAYYRQLVDHLVSDEMKTELDAHRDRIRAWQTANPGQVKIPD